MTITEICRIFIYNNTGEPKIKTINQINPMNTVNTHRKISEIEADLKVATKNRKNWINLQNEGGEGYVDESVIESLVAELVDAKAAQSPLKTNLAGEKAWFNAQGFTGADMQKAQKACLARGYTVSDLMIAAKAAKK